MSQDPKDTKARENAQNKAGDSAKFTEGVRKPAVEIPKVKPSGNFALTAGILGLALIGGGVYYYLNYMKKPEPKPLYQPSTQTKQDAQNFLNATNKLFADLTKETKAIVDAGNKLTDQIRKEGKHIVDTASQAATNIKK